MGEQGDVFFEPNIHWKFGSGTIQLAGTYNIGRLVEVLVKTQKIRRCPECSDLFLKIRKQKYCSRTCVNRVNKRDWREAQRRAQGYCVVVAYG